MNGLVSFFATPRGRYARIFGGAIIVIAGMTIEFAVSSTVGWIVTIIGLLPLLAGMFDVCLFAPLAKLPLRGPRLREALAANTGDAVAAGDADEVDADEVDTPEETATNRPPDNVDEEPADDYDDYDDLDADDT